MGKLVSESLLTCNFTHTPIARALDKIPNLSGYVSTAIKTLITLVGPEWHLLGMVRHYFTKARKRLWSYVGLNHFK